MKLTTFAAMAATALLATSLAHATPELTADDMSAGNNEPTGSQSNEMATQTASSGNIGGTSGMSNTNNTNDDMSADTATGDDDY